MLTKIPQGLDGIIATFGNCEDPDFERENIVHFELPYTLVYDGMRVARTRCHRLAVDNFRAALIGVKNAGLENEVKAFGGIYNKRPQRGNSARLSTHSWGIAIDLEPLRYPRGSVRRFPDAVVDAFAKAGFFYGGDFKKTPDPMHFQLAVRY